MSQALRAWLLSPVPPGRTLDITPRDSGAPSAPPTRVLLLETSKRRPVDCFEPNKIFVRSDLEEILRSNSSNEALAGDNLRPRYHSACALIGLGTDWESFRCAAGNDGQTRFDLQNRSHRPLPRFPAESRSSDDRRREALSESRTAADSS
jgi:hypothetical protein